MTERVRVFDTTLRDGEQSPGARLSVADKVEIAQQLGRLGVDVIEAGFPISSPGDFEAVRQVASRIRGPVICALARAYPEDVDRAAEALANAPYRRIHVFISTSDIHLEHQLHLSRSEVVRLAVDAVRRARRSTDDVEFSPMDASRTEQAFLCEVLEHAVGAGATTINIPDTVGYATPDEFAALIGTIQERVVAGRDVIISVHCHDDLGLAVANSLAGVRAGARQVECTVNGIGERAGNAALEEIVMALRTRADVFHVGTGIDTTQLQRTSELVGACTGLSVAASKAVVGANAFAHESGIHQDGVLKERTTYEIIDPASVGASGSIVLGKLSGRHALASRAAALGLALDQAALNQLFHAFKGLADSRPGPVTDADIAALAKSLEMAVAS
jgi:2-isopropylmalate synthase